LFSPLFNITSQRLFGRLALSPRAAVDSTGLTTSFGWEGEEAFVQHDAQELMRVMFEALKLSDTFSEGDAVSFSSLLPQLFSGVSADILKCSQCGHKSIKEDLFYDICLPVEGMQVTTSVSQLSESSPTTTESATFTPLTSLHRSLRSFLSAESLSGSDQWSCSGMCNGARVDATKSLSLIKLPPVMTIHLKRFSYNASTGKYAKVNDPFSFPLEVDFDGFLANAKEAVLSSAALKEESNDKPPCLSDSTVAPYLPSSRGSACSAVQALRAIRISLEAGDLAALSRGDALTEEEGEALEHMKEREKRKVVIIHDAASISDPDGTASNIFSAPAPTDSQCTPSSLYELYSILMHSGVTSRGHYFAFIRSPQEPSLSSSSTWLLMNDSTVLLLTEVEVLTASGATTGLPEEYVSSMYGSSAPSGNAKSIPPGGSPYMLLYRRKNFLSAVERSSPIPLPQSVREAVQDPAVIAYAVAMGCGYLGCDELTDLATECKSFNALKDCHRVRQLLCELRVRLPKLALSRDDEAEVLREASQHMQSSLTETATIYRLPFFEDDAGQSDFSSVFVPLSSSIDSATSACFSLLIEAHGGKKSFKERNCLIELPKLSDIRLRKFDAHTKKKTESYSHSDAPSTPFEADWGLAVDVAIEVRAPVDAIQLPWPDYNPEAISVRVLKWKGSSLIQETIRRLSSIAEGTACEENLSSIPLDGRTAAILELSGTEGSPATVATLFTSLVDSILDPTVSCSTTIPKTVHAVVLPGGLPTPSDIVSGVAAGRRRQRMSPISSSSLTPHHSSLLRVITIPISGDESEEVVTLMNMELSKSFGLCDGDDLIIIEETDDDIANEDLERSLLIFKSLFSSSTIRVTFKAMDSSINHCIDASDQIFTLTARRDETLLSLKRRMIETLNASLVSPLSQSTCDATHLKRNNRSPMLRDEDKTLRELDIGDGANLFICEGPVLIDDTAQVRVFLHSAKQQIICTVPVKLSSRAIALKKKIFETLTFSSLPLSCTTSPLHSANHIRLRGRQTAAGSTSTSILRDEAVLRQALGVAISYSGGDDERDVFVEFLENPETFGKNDLVIRATEFIKGGEGTRSSSHLTPLIDIVLPKTSTLGSLSSLLTGLERCLCVVRVAKHSAYGPALNAWEAENKIRYLTINDDAANTSVCDPPLRLCDGCSLLWRRDAGKEDENRLSVYSDSKGIEDNKENGVQQEKKTSSAPLKRPWMVKKGTNVNTVEEASTAAVMGGISIRVKGISE